MRTACARNLSAGAAAGAAVAPGGASAGASVAADRARLPSSPRGRSPPAASRPAARWRRRRRRRRRRWLRTGRRARGDPCQRSVRSAPCSSRTAGLACIPPPPPPPRRRRSAAAATGQHPTGTATIAAAGQRTASAHSPQPTAAVPTPRAHSTHRSSTTRARGSGCSSHTATARLPRNLAQPRATARDLARPRTTLHNLARPRATSRNLAQPRARAS